MSEPQIELVGVTRRFEVRRRQGLRHRTRLVQALADVSFAVAEGEAVGLLGTAGAGKSTLIEIIAGIRTPTAGHVRTGGLSPVRQQAELVKRIGLVVGGRTRLWPDLAAAESFRIAAAAGRLPVGRWQLRQDELVEQLDLGGVLHTPVKLLTPGQRMRAETAVALLHEPEIILLDGPTAELDSLSRERLRSFLRHENRAHGRTVLLSTQDIADLEPVCERILLLGRGRLAYDGTLPSLVETGGGRVLVVDLVEPGQALDGITGTQVVAVEAGGLRQRLALGPGPTSTAQVLAELAERVKIRDVTLVEPGLDEVVRRLQRGA